MKKYCMTKELCGPKVDQVRPEKNVGIRELAFDE